MEFFNGIEQMLKIICLTAVIVLLAQGIDLAAGLYKAKIRGEVRSSWGLKRSVSKFILYEGAIMIAGGVDTLMHICRLMDLVGLNALQGVVPLMTVSIGILLCAVEIWSLRETADKKTAKDLARTASIISGIIDRNQLTSAIAQAIESAITRIPTTTGKEGGNEVKQ